MRSGPVSGAYLAFGNLFSILDNLAQNLCRGRGSVLPQLVVPYFAQIHDRPAPLCVETEEDLMWRVVDENLGREWEETVVST